MRTPMSDPAEELPPLSDGSGDAGADAWAAADGEEAMMGSERILNQDEIDSLLGFNEEASGTGDRSGIRAILDSSLVSYERLPMLEIVFDRLVRLLTSSLRNFFSDTVEVTLDNISSVRFGDYINSIPLPSILLVFRAHEWDNYGLLSVDSSLAYGVLDVLLGGRRGPTVARLDGRPYTSIEMNLVRRLLELVLSEAESAFLPLSPVGDSATSAYLELRLPWRLEESRHAHAGRRSNKCFLISSLPFRA